MSGRVRTRESKSGEQIAYSESAIRHNASAVEYCRTSMAALSGCTAGNFCFQQFQLLYKSTEMILRLYSILSLCRYHWIYRSHRFSILFGSCARSLDSVDVENGCQLAKVFY